MTDHEDEAARRVLAAVGFELVEHEQVSKLHWIERWRLARDPDLSADLGRHQGDLTVWLRSEQLVIGTLPDVWLRAAIGTPIDLRERQSIRRQLDILLQFLPTIENFAREPDAAERLGQAARYVEGLFFPR